ncbi:MAG TPA: DNA-protecting protein DprA [bacterium]|nr:DNA-protecting protein DprA [bacterium]HPS30411.1 DNA-protecting protein DprA [bacterium]
MLKAEPGNINHPDILLNCRPEIGVSVFIDGSMKDLDSNGVAIVGSRKPSLYGIKMAQCSAEAAVRNGKTVISGLARGIDTESHRGALLAGGRTVAVLGTGIDTIYPEENIGLAEEIKQNGALISQFPPLTPPLKQNFPIRNAIVAKMCSVLILVQASTKSGSLITARLAREFGKKVFVIPGQMNDDLFSGNYQFLRSRKNDPGVELLTDFSQIDEFFSCKKSIIRDISRVHPSIIEELAKDELAVYNAVINSTGGIDFDSLSLQCGLSSSALPAALLSLMMKDIIFEEPGKIYKTIGEKL